MFLSAVQPQPNARGVARGVTTALVAGIPLCRAALKGATSSLAQELRSGSVAEQLEDKSLEASSNRRFPGSSSNIVLQRPHCADPTARSQRGRCLQIDQTGSLNIFTNMIEFAL